jgi:hypothetical protein
MRMKLKTKDIVRKYDYADERSMKIARAAIKEREEALRLMADD